MLQIIVILITAYILGSIPFSLIIARLSKGIDVRSSGSGNVGATNVLRTVGKKEAAIALTGDILKGTLSVWMAIIFLQDFWVGVTAILVVLGHVFPVFSGFKGGKGVATSLGALIVIVPSAVIIAVFTWILVLVISRLASLASIIASLAMPFICWSLKTPVSFIMAAVVTSVIILLKHTGNMKRIYNGTESRVF